MSKSKLIFNPISGTVEFTTVENRIDGRIDIFANLPLASSATGEIYIVEQDTGSIFLFNKKEAGLYRSNGTSWEAYTDITSQSVEIDDTNIGSGSTNLQAALDYIAAQALLGNQVVSGSLVNSDNTLRLVLQDTNVVDVDVTSLNNSDKLSATDIDTLAELNTILTDATLIDTNDSRLSDARTPLAHTHVEADIIDLDKYTQAEVDALIAAIDQDTNLARIISGSLSSGTLTLTRDDATTFDVNLSGLDNVLQIAVVQAAVDAHEARTDNPHSVTATQLGLGSVDNTSDLNKPVSTATQTILDGKVDNSQVLTNVPLGAVFTDNDTIYDDTTIQAEVDLNTAKISATGSELEATDISTLAELNVLVTDATLIDTTDARLSDARTPLAHTHVIADITDAADVASSNDYNDLDNLPTITTAPVDSINGQTGVVVLDKDDVGLANVDNTSDINKPVSTATQTALDGKVDDSQVLTNVPLGAVFTDNDTIYDDTTIQAEVDLNTAKVSADGSINTHSNVDITTVAPTSGDVLEFDGANFVPVTPGPGGIVADADPQTNLAGTALLDDLVLNTTTGEIEKFNGTDFVQLTNDAETTEAAAAGSTLGLQQELLANAGQPGLTVLAVGFTNTGKVQGTSLGDGNVVEVYASGADFNAGTVLYREFMSLGEPIVFTGVANGAIITSTQGFYGMSEQFIGGSESPMPLLSYGLSFKNTFVFAFRNSTTLTGTTNQGTIRLVNGPLPSVVKLEFGSGGVVNGQEGISLEPWEFTSLQTEGNTEYIIDSTNPVMACIHARTNVAGDGASAFYDSKLVMPLTNDGITWPRSGNVSAPFDNTSVDWFVRDGAEGNFVVSPGSPVDFDANGTGTGAGDQDYEPNGATRVLATGLISAYSGADSAGLEASPLMPTSAMSQVIAQPQTIDDSGDGGNSGIAIASPYAGEAKVYSWNDVTSSLVLEYVIPLTRNSGAISSKEDQKHPAAGGVANEATTYPVQLVGNLSPGVIIANVPITVIIQSNVSAQTTIRSQNGTTATTIINEDDETLMLGITPENIKAEFREGTDGITYRREIGAGGIDTWEEA